MLHRSLSLSGKGVNIWDTLTHEHPDFITDQSTGDIAANSYYKYKEDVQLLKEIGVSTVRYTICRHDIYCGMFVARCMETEAET
jgi:beta-glucosidase/6-phospho-beta-glucosidase/beta-galactosidase